MFCGSSASFSARIASSASGPSSAFRYFCLPCPMPCSPVQVPPTLGEHNREILGGMLGLSDAELEELSRDGIIGTEMLMEEQLVKEKKRAAG